MTHFILAGIFKKLNYKVQPVLHVLQAPESFNNQLSVLEGKANIERHVIGEIHFAIGFVQLTDKLDQMVHAVAPKLLGESYLLDHLSGGHIGKLCLTFYSGQMGSHG